MTMCGLPLFPPKPKHKSTPRIRRTFRLAGRSETPLVVRSTMTWFPASSQATPAERADPCLKERGEPQ
jgi:hypothetical protein